MNCSSCGSSMAKNGTRAASNGIIKQQYRCGSCGHHASVATNSPPVITEGVATASELAGTMTGKIWLAGPKGASRCLVIPAKLADKYHFGKGDDVTFKEERGGILISKRSA